MLMEEERSDRRDGMGTFLYGPAICSTPATSWKSPAPPCPSNGFNALYVHGFLKK